MGSRELFSAIAEAKKNETVEERLIRLRDMSKRILATEDTDRVTLRSNDFPSKPEIEAQLRIVDGSLLEPQSDHADADVLLQYFPSPQGTPTQITRYLMLGFTETEDGTNMVSRRVISQLEKDHAPNLPQEPTQKDLDEIELMLLDPACSVSEKNPTYTQIAEQKSVNREKKEARVRESAIERLKRVREMLNSLQAN